MTTMQTYQDIETVEIEKLDVSNYLPRLNEVYSAGSGLPVGRAVLISGDSGAGKTTFFCTLQSKLNHIRTAMYQVESPASDVRSRNNQLDLNDNCLIEDLNTCSNLDLFIQRSIENNVRIMVIDSLQVVAEHYLEECGGSELKAVKMAYKKMIKWSKDYKGIVYIISHVTKEGNFKGDNGIMQMMDAHIEFRVDDVTSEKYIEFGQKNRDGEKGEPTRLYYTFNGAGKGISLHTPQEWAVIHKRTEIFEYLKPVIKGYMDAFKNHLEYKVFKKEMSIYQDELLGDENLTQGEFIGKMVDKINELSEVLRLL